MVTLRGNMDKYAHMLIICSSCNTICGDIWVIMCIDHGHNNIWVIMCIDHGHNIITFSDAYMC